MYERAAIVGLYAETPLHPGQGSASGVVDLPVARERHLDFPIIPGSTLKGVLRAQARRVWGQSERLLAVFGPDTDHAGDHAGALAFSDARLLLFPVRSLRGVFAWTTGPLALDRYRRDLAAAGLQAPWQVPVPLAGQAFATRPSAVIAEGQIMLEEFTFEAQERPEVTAIAEDLARNLFPASAEYEPWRRRVERQLVVLTDDDFSDFVQTATEVVARIRINPTTGAADDGGLWYEEYVPSEALFYSLALASLPRRAPNGAADTPRTAADVLAAIDDLGLDRLQIGGDETVGRGIVKLRLRSTGGGMA